MYGCSPCAVAAPGWPRSAMSDAAQSHRRAAAVENPAPSKAVKAAAGKTWRSRRADVDPSGVAKPVEIPDAHKTWGGRRADVDSCGPAKPIQTAAASKAGRDRRANVGNSGAVKLMKIAAAKAAVESAAGKTGGDGRGAGAEIRRGGNAAGAKAMQAWGGAESMKRRSAAGAQAPRRLQAWVNGVRRPGTGNDNARAVAPDRGAAKGV